MIVIRDATIITVDADDTIHPGAAIAVADDRIVAIGPSDTVIAAHPDSEVVDGRGKAVMPGFANVHTHFSLIIAKGIYEDLSPPNRPPFSSGLAPIPTPDLNPDEMRAMCRLAALEAIRSGTTAVLEDGTDIHVYADAIVDTGLRLLLCERSWDKANGGIGDQGGFEVDRALGNRTMQSIADLHATWHGAAGDRIRVGVAAWAPDMCSPELLRDLRGLQDRLRTVATIHLNQIWGEVAAVQAVRGRLPTEYLEDVGFLSDRLICAHCRCMEPGEEKILGRCRCSVAFNSAIAARRGLSPRIADLESYGCAIGMGSDNMSEDMVEVVRTGMFMERVRRGDGRQPTPEAALRWGTTNGYRALGWTDGGSLTVGNKADLVVIDLQRAHLTPLTRPVACFVHQGQPSDVTGVMVDGRWLMRDGRVVTMDEATVVREAQEVATRAWRRLFESRPDLQPPPGLHLDGSNVILS
jgi:5-methylthioadenosine/S-adenosylhomocysteine deaminase